MGKVFLLLLQKKKSLAFLSEAAACSKIRNILQARHHIGDVPAARTAAPVLRLGPARLAG